MMIQGREADEKRNPMSRMPLGCLLGCEEALLPEVRVEPGGGPAIRPAGEERVSGGAVLRSGIHSAVRVDDGLPPRVCLYPGRGGMRVSHPQPT